MPLMMLNGCHFRHTRVEDAIGGGGCGVFDHRALLLVMGSSFMVDTLVVGLCEEDLSFYVLCVL